jgi:hypothetical protein
MYGQTREDGEEVVKNLTAVTRQRSGFVRAPGMARSARKALSTGERKRTGK